MKGAGNTQARVFDYGGGAVAAVCEGGVGDGLGARVWLAAQVTPPAWPCRSTSVEQA